MFDTKEELPEALTELGDGVRYFRIDITDEGMVSTAVADVASAWGTPDVLVNAAAIPGSGKPTHEASVADFDADDLFMAAG